MSQIIEVRRSIFGDKSTVGEMYSPDGEFLCHTLEDPVRKIKIKGNTAIPPGKYELAITFSQKYGRLMPRLLEVPFYTGILIHPGNIPEHTEGCILVGKHDHNIKDFIGHSRDTFDRIFPILKKLVEKDEVFIQVNGGYDSDMWATA